MNDSHDLQRFVEAQRSTYDRALEELLAGRKRTHWMWFVFPQLRGLGHSDMARRYAISGRREALAYLQHPLLGPRLEACTRAMLGHRGESARRLLGTPDELKFHSCMTLFAQVAPDPRLFDEALQAFFEGRPDPASLAGLGD